MVDLLSLDLVIIFLPSSIVIKGVSFHLTIFFFIGACLSRTMMFFLTDKPIARFLINFVKKIVFVKIFIVPIFNIFKRKFLNVGLKKCKY